MPVPVAANGFPLCNKRYAAPDDPCIAYLNPAGWHCTMVWSAYLGLPLSLKNVGAALGLSVCRARAERGTCRIHHGKVGDFQGLYQKYATRFIVEHPVAVVLLQMDLGKSVIILTAIAELALECFEVCHVLIIAPLRVARDTWPAEIQQLDHLKGLTYSVAVGTEAERRSALRQNTLMHIINWENVQWLIEQSGLPFQYDMLVIDELSSKGIRPSGSGRG